MAIIADNFESGVATQVELSELDDAALLQWVTNPEAAEEYLRRKYGAERSLPAGAYDARFNPNHDNKGQFAKSAAGGTTVVDRPLPRRLTDEQYTAILPGPGQTRAEALRALRSTPEGQELLDAALLWQDDMSAVGTMQKNFIARSQGKKLTKDADKRVTALMDGIRNSPVSPPLYRGARMSKGFDPETALKPGTSFTLAPSSFSSSERIARGFAKQKVRRETVPVVYRVKAARGVPVEVFGHSSYKNEKEWISAGQYVVTSASKGRDGIYTVDVDHVAMFSW